MSKTVRWRYAQTNKSTGIKRGFMGAKRVLYKRSDNKWAWRLVVNGSIVATDGSQGYENKGDARDMADRIITGEFSGAERRIIE